MRPQVEGLAGIHFSKQNKPEAATGRDTELQPPTPPPGKAPDPVAGFCSLSPLPVCSAALISQMPGGAVSPRDPLP